MSCPSPVPCWCPLGSMYIFHPGENHVSPAHESHSFPSATVRCGVVPIHLLLRCHVLALPVLFISGNGEQRAGGGGSTGMPSHRAASVPASVANRRILICWPTSFCNTDFPYLPPPQAHRFYSLLGSPRFL